MNTPATKADYARRIEKAADYLPENTVRRPLIRLANTYLIEEDDDAYNRMCDIAEGAIKHYPEFARAMGRMRHTLTSAEAERIMPEWYWAATRARLTSGR